MKLINLILESRTHFDGGVGYSSLYQNDFAKRITPKLLKIFSPYTRSQNKYRIDYSDANSITWKFYVPLIVQDREHGENLLRKLMSFAEKNKSKIRIFVEAHDVCVEIKVRK